MINHNLLVVHAKEFGMGLPRCAAKYFTLNFHFFLFFLLAFILVS